MCPILFGGIMPNTKEYMKKYNKQYYIDHKEKMNKRSKQRCKNNLEKIKEYMKQYSKDNYQKIKERNKKYYRNNQKIKKEKIRQWCINNREIILIYLLIRYNKFKTYHKEFYVTNREKYKKYRIKNRIRLLKYQKQYRLDHPNLIKRNYEKNVEKTREYHNYRYKTDLKYNLSRKMSRTIRLSLKGKKSGRHWEDLVGYTCNDLIKRLKKTIPEGYNWNDYIKGVLEVDHKIPISVFNYTKPEHPDFKCCWALSNLQLLLKEKNRTKRAKIYKPFQPALKLKLYKVGDLYAKGR